LDKSKVFLVEKGYSQIEGFDFCDSFPPLAKLNSIRFVLSIIFSFDLEVEYMNVNKTFLHGDLDE